MRAYNITITGEAPSKKNSRVVNTRTGRTFPSKRYRQWHDTAVKEIKFFWKNRKPLEKVSATFCFFHKDNRRRDSDNQVSSVLDTLIDAGVLDDDKWQEIYEHRVVNARDPGKKGFCTVLLFEEETE